MSNLSNDFARFTIINLDPEAPSRGPFVVSQRGTDPDDPRLVEKAFLLSKEGWWVAWADSLASEEPLAEFLLFDDAPEMVAAIEGLEGKPVIRHLKVDTQVGLQRLAAIEAAGGLRAAVHQLLFQRDRHRSQ